MALDRYGTPWLAGAVDDLRLRAQHRHTDDLRDPEGLNGPYTYSDMTSAMLELVALPPEE